MSWDDVPAWPAVGDAGEAQRTPDLTTILRELVNLEGWTAESPVHLLLTVAPEGGKRSAFSVDQSEVARPRLSVVFESDVAVTEIAAPGTPEGTILDGSIAQIFWTDPNPEGIVNGYELLIDGKLSPTIFRGRTTEILPDWRGREELTVCVRALGDLYQPSEFSPCATFSLTSSVGEVKYMPIDVFPNPVDVMLHVRAGDVSLRQVELFDAVGRRVLRKSVPGGVARYDLAVDGLAPGAYHLRVTAVGGAVGVRAVIVR